MIQLSLPDQEADRAWETLSVDREYPGETVVACKRILDRPGIPDNDV